VFGGEEFMENLEVIKIDIQIDEVQEMAKDKW